MQVGDRIPTHQGNPSVIDTHRWLILENASEIILVLESRFHCPFARGYLLHREVILLDLLMVN
jgi:hypothetical protein